jgi:hypothetical protein
VGAITYIAERGLMAGHVASVEYLLLIDFTDDTVRSVATEKIENRSLSGASEVLRYYSDANWTVVFAPTAIADMAQVREFLASTDGGEPFSIDLYGTGVSITVMRTDTGHTETPFSRVGTELKDVVQAQITVREL